MQALLEVSSRGSWSLGLRLALAVLMLMGPTVSAKEKVDSKLVGEWRARDGMLELVLRINADGRCELDEERGSCTTQGGALTFQGPETGREQYRYQLAGNTLTLSGGDLDGPMRFERAGGGKAPPMRQPEPAQEETAEVAAPTPTPSGPGQPFQKEAWGVRFTVPAGWKHAEKSGIVLVVSDTEAGLMLVRYMPRFNAQQAEQEFAQGVTDENVQLQPSGSLKAWRGPSAQGLTGMMTGMTKQGEQVRARAIALFNKGGGGLLLIALTTPERFAGLDKRLEQLARSVSLTTPKVPKGRAAIAGSYWFYSSSSGGSSGAKFHLCANGSFRREGEMSGGNYGGTASMASQDSGTWSAQGTASSGTLTLQYASGEVQQVEYEASQDPRDRSGYGPALIIGGRKYQKTGDGNCS